MRRTSRVSHIRSPSSLGIQFVKLAPCPFTKMAVPCLPACQFRISSKISREGAACHGRDKGDSCKGSRILPARLPCGGFRRKEGDCASLESEQRIPSATFNVHGGGGSSARVCITRPRSRASLNSDAYLACCLHTCSLALHDLIVANTS